MRASPTLALRRPRTTDGWCLAAAGATAAIIAGDSWRTALVAALAAGAIIATRVRYALAAAAALLLAAAALALGGSAAARSQRTASASPTTVHRQHRSDQGAAHAKRHSHRRNQARGRRASSG